MTEAPEAIKSERDFLWQKCNELYNGITHNGQMTASSFAQAIGVAGSLFKEKGMNMGPSNNWFAALISFLFTVEKARQQKVGPKC